MNQDRIFAAIETELKSMDRTKAWLCTQIGVSTQALNNWSVRGIPSSRIDDIAEVFGWDSDELRRGRVISSNDELALPLYDIQASMGDGTNPGESGIEPIVSFLKISRRWVSTALVCTSPSNLVLITVTGNSMTPTFSDGDTLIVDKGVNSLGHDGVYVLFRDGNLFVKRLELMLSGGILVSSDNPEHKPYTINTEEFSSVRIVGKALWAFTGRQL